MIGRIFAKGHERFLFELALVLLGLAELCLPAQSVGATRGNEDRERAEKFLFSLFPSVLALVALIQGFFSPSYKPFSSSFKIARIKTLAPLAISEAVVNSFGEWLIPPTLGTKIIPIGTIRARF